MAALRLPGRTLVAEGNGRTAQGALDNVLRDLADEIDRLEETPAGHDHRGQEVETVQGETLTVGVTDAGVTLTDAGGNTVNVVAADVDASNGVIHAIDGVLIPAAAS